MTKLEQLFEYASNQSEFVVDVQKGMTAIPAMAPENGGDGESRKAAYLKQYMQKLGATEIIEINAKDNRVSSGARPNIAAKLPGKSAVTLWVIGHMDVVPVGEKSLWNSNPFELKQDGDIIIGRGVEDNQQAIAASMLAFKTLKDNNVTPDLNYGVLMVADEETHSAYGLEHVLKAAPDLIKKDDLVLIPDIGDSLGQHVEVAEKSCSWLKITVSGKQCHASTPEEGINSLMASSAAVLALDALYKHFPQSDPLYQPATSTFVPSKKEANVENINTVPGQDIFYIDCRILPQIDPKDVFKKVEELVAEAVKPYKATARVETVFADTAPTPTAVNAPVVQRLSRSLKKLRNIEAKPIGIGGQTVAAFLRAVGIPAVGWSTIISNAHTPNEKSSIINTISDSKVIIDMLFD